MNVTKKETEKNNLFWSGRTFTISRIGCHKGGIWYVFSHCRETECLKIEEALQANDSDQIKEWEKKLGDECLKTAGCYLSLEKDDELNLLVFEPMKDKTSQIICVYLKKFAPKTLSDNWIIFDCIPPLSEKIYHYRFQVEEKDYTIDDMVENIIFR